MALHKIVESDIVLSEIYGCARELGFDQLRVGLSPLHAMAVDYEEYAAFPSNAEVVNKFVEVTDWRVKNYPIFFLRKRGTAVIDSRGNEGLRCSLTVTSPLSIVCRPGEPIEITLQAENTGAAAWLASGRKPGMVNIGMIVTREDGSSAFHRSDLSSVPVTPGMHVEAVAVIPGLSQGAYNIELDLFSEYVTWFKNHGSSAVNLRVTVT